MAEVQTVKSTEVLSLQSRIEQCEAAIQTAHTTLNRIESPDEKAGEEPKSDGAMATINRCISEMGDLNARLSALAEKVGAL